MTANNRSLFWALLAGVFMAFTSAAQAELKPIAQLTMKYQESMDRQMKDGRCAGLREAGF